MLGEQYFALRCSVDEPASVVQSHVSTIQVSFPSLGRVSIYFFGFGAFVDYRVISKRTRLVG